MEWKTVKLGDYIQDIAAGPFGSNLKVECFVPDGFPIIDGANLRGYTVTDNVTKFVTEEKARSLYRSIAKRGEVVVTISGNVGQIAYIPYDSKYEEYLVSQRQFRVRFKDSVNVPYLVYYFHSREGQHQILSFANQTGVPALAQPLKNFRNIELPLPPLETQRRIAAILSSLDDKIENNNRINRNLEAQAQALFKSWFVDFEPWGGSMPDDWKNGVLGEICKIKYGKGLSTNLLTDEGYPVFGGNGVIGYYSKFLYELPQILVSCRGAASGKIMESDPHSFVTSNSLVLEMNDRAYYYYLKYLLLANPLYNYATGSAQPQITIDNIKDIDIVLPSIDIVNTISEKFEVIDEQIRSLRRENHRLATLRDTLLPKLMRGEITL